jgi:DNA adenine methylase
MNNGKPFLRWAGSKRQLISRLNSYWGQGFTRYIEPFMGSAAFFFAIEPPNAILSDINEGLVETFCAVRDHPRAVHNRLARFPLGEDAYYQIRQETVSRMLPVDRAARFIYLNRFCFNGLYRTNMSGYFNVPYSASKTGQLPTLEDLCRAARILNGAQIVANDFEKTIQDVKAGDFVYMDPPYAVKNRRVFRQYGPDSFGTEDLGRLTATLSVIDGRGAKFLVSYALCREAMEAFNGWYIHRAYTQRSVAGFSRHRRKAVEILVSNLKLPPKGRGTNCSEDLVRANHA